MSRAKASAIWNDRRHRAVLYQVLAVAGVFAVVWWLTQNTIENLTRLKITSGFDFLGAAAGFDIIMSLVDYSPQSSYGQAFVVGLLNTLLVAAIGIVAATVIGFTIGIARVSRNWLVARLAAAYIETLRNVPLLLQLFFWYFAVLRALPGPRDSLNLGAAIFANNRGLYLPWPEWGAAGWWTAIASIFIGVAALSASFWLRRRRPEHADKLLGAAIGFPLIYIVVGLSFADWSLPALQGFNFRGGAVLIPELLALLLALSIYTAAFIAENVRAGLESVPRGQVEAARALGLSEWQTMRLVIVPLALRVIVPPLTNQYLNLTKNSSLAAAIAYPDLVSVFAGAVLNQTGQAVEVIAITMAVYLFISLAISGVMNLYNRWILRTGL